MSEPASARMTADDFIVWAMSRPEHERYELADGEVIAMAPERAAHADAKGHLYRRLMDAVERDNLNCRAYVDRLAVVIEVLSRSTKGRDVGVKLTDYFSLPSVRHYSIVRADARINVHHARQDDGTILTRITHGEPILLDPP